MSVKARPAQPGIRGKRKGSPRLGMGERELGLGVPFFISIPIIIIVDKKNYTVLYQDGNLYVFKKSLHGLSHLVFK